MKKFVCIALILLAFAVFAACAKDEAAVSGENSASSEISEAAES